MRLASVHPALTKLRTGVDGFDEITNGGIPGGRTTLLVGGAGCGKTVLALQTLVNGAHKFREAAIFVAFEEPADHIVANAATFRWDLPALAKRKLFFLDARLTPDSVHAGSFDLVGLLAMLESKAKEINATRIVFDGIDVLLGLLNDPIVERREIYRLRDWLARTGLTAIITQKVSGFAEDSKFGFLQFMVDCVVVLRQQVIDGSTFRTLRVVKYRGSDFAADEFPITLTSEALQLFNRGPTELVYKVSKERISSGFAELDAMLHGGYFRGSNTLISGWPGTAKSILAGLFAAAACARRERTLYVSFDEGAAQIVRNFRSVNINLAPYVKSGMLTIFSTRTSGPNVEDQYSALRDRVERYKPRAVIIDPLSALTTKVEHVAYADAARQFLDTLKVQRITCVNTSLVSVSRADEATATGISTMADTWIRLAFIVRAGVRRRTLTIVKSRGTAHSQVVRELMLNGRGVTLRDLPEAEICSVCGAPTTRPPAGTA